jgi:hypothetical protein
MKPLLDLDAAWDAHVAVVLADRDAPEELHASDLWQCPLALQKRVQGEPQLPHDDGSFANFERGLAYETRLDAAIRAYAEPLGFEVTHGGKCEYRGIVGNLDWTLARNGKIEAIVDLSTTAFSKPDWKYGHALKSAFYAIASGCETFCEWVFCIGHGGKIVAQQPFWFNVNNEFNSFTWRDLVEDAITAAKADSEFSEPWPAIPPTDPRTGELETWRCGKVGKNGVGTSYCRARCSRNAAYTPEEIPA